MFDWFAFCNKSYKGQAATKEQLIIYVTNEKITKDQYKQITGEDLPVLSLEDTIDNKINSLSIECQNRIYAGFDSDCWDSTNKRHYDYEDKDQTFINGLISKAGLMLQNVPTDGKLEWKSSGEAVCYQWDPQKILKLGLDAYNHVSDNRIQYEKLRQYVKTLTTVDAVNAVTFDTVVPVANE